MSTYEPRTFGARCDLCPLAKDRVGGPVEPEINPGAMALIISDHPEKEDCDAGRHLIGKDAKDLYGAMAVAGINRETFSYSAACLCKPPGKNMGEYLARLKASNKKLVKAGKVPVPTPQACCKFRMDSEIDQHSNIISLGAYAYESVVGKPGPVLRVRGAPVELTPRAKSLKLLPTLHPKFVQHVRKWTRAFRSDIQRAYRWFTGNGVWVEPIEVFNPRPAELRKFLDPGDGNKIMAVDYETSWDGALLCTPYCLGFSDGVTAMCVQFKSVEQNGMVPYTDAEMAEIYEIIARFGGDDRIKKVAHNLAFDQPVFERQFGVRLKNVLDTILLHRSTESELPHKLEYVGSVFTSIDRAWKADNTAKHAKTDRELQIYNNVDTTITARVAPVLAQLVRTRGQQEVVKIDHKLQQVCIGMHRNGMYVDMERRNGYNMWAKAFQTQLKREIRDIIGDQKFNPGSVEQVRDIIYDKWKLPVLNETEGGLPKTDNETLTALCLTAGLQEKQDRFLNDLRFYRRFASLRGTRIVKMKPRDEIIDYDDDAVDDDRFEFDELDKGAEMSEKEFAMKDEEKRGLIHKDGRFHPGWNVHVPVSGRFSAQLVQNWPIPLRDIFRAAPGNVLVGADMDALELRMVSAVAGIGLYVDCFNRGDDPHTLSALLVSGEKVRPIYEAAKKRWGTDKKARKLDRTWARIVDFAKRFTYSSVYAAGSETVHEILRSAEDDNGMLVNKNLQLEVTVKTHENWLKQVPELTDYWRTVEDRFHSQGFLADPIHHRRRDFLDGEKKQELANHEIQAGGAALVNDATLELVQRIPFGKWGPGTGLINQCHDALLVECPKDQGAWVAKQIEECMTRRYPQLPLLFPATAKIGTYWNEV